MQLLNSPIIDSSAIIGPGCVIGNDGFGYAKVEDKYILKPHSFTVIIEKDVELHANVTVDRGRWRNTIIGEGTKIDAGAHIGHNVIIGKNCIIGSHVVLAGSVEIGDNSQVWINCTIGEHVKIGRNTIIGAHSYLRHDTGDNEVWYGDPAKKVRDLE